MNDTKDFDLNEKMVIEIYENFKNQFKAIDNASEREKELLVNIREESAQITQQYTKDNEPDIKSIKASLMKKAIGIHLQDKPNKLEEDLNTQEEYIKLLNNNTILVEQGEQYLEACENTKEAKTNIKEYSKQKELEGVDKELLKVLKQCAQQELENQSDKPNKNNTALTFELQQYIYNFTQKRGELI